MRIIFLNTGIVITILKFFSFKWSILKVFLRHGKSCMLLLLPKALSSIIVIELQCRLQV